ncbi:MAG: Histidine racemase [Desulfovibrio sp.]
MRPSLFEALMPTFTLPFIKLCPGGNPTILIDSEPAYALPAQMRAEIAAALLHADHLHGDQVGFLSMTGAMPHLEMMGGEFCVNAARSAAAVFARKGSLPQTGQDEWQGEISVSGADRPVTVAVRSANATPGSTTVYDSALALPLAGISYPATASAAGETLVRLPGITHLLIDCAASPRPADIIKAAAEKRQEYGLEKEEAAGVVWYEKKQDGAYAIAPVVYVAATDSSVFESACGSGSLAVALIAAPQGEISVFQPSGHALSIRFTGETAWIGGSVTITAHGETYVSV